MGKGMRLVKVEGINDIAIGQEAPTAKAVQSTTNALLSL